MQKKLIVLALAGIAAAPVFAQSNVTIYGKLDYGYVSRSDDDGAVGKRDRKNEMASGVDGGSRLGFKGSEDLGNGLKAIFEVETGLIMDESSTSSGNSGLFSTNRHSWIGLTGNFGTVIGGRLDGVRYGVFNKYDAFAGGNIGNFTQVTAQVDRASNAIAYISPSFSGLTATLAYSTHIGNSNPLGLSPTEGGDALVKGDGNDGDAELATVMLTYTNGPISINADWETVMFEETDKLTATGNVIDDVTVWTIAGSYDFGMVKLAALYDNLKADGRGSLGTVSDVDSWFVSASAPLMGGKFVLKATYGQTNDDELSNDKITKWGLGADYNLSKRSKIYAGYGKINNDDNAAAEINFAANSQGAGYGTEGFELGMQHNF